MLCKKCRSFAPGLLLLTSHFRYGLTLLVYPTILSTLCDVMQGFDVHFIVPSHFNSGVPPKHRILGRAHMPFYTSYVSCQNLLPCRVI